MDAQVAELNQLLSSIPVRGSYHLQVTVAGHTGRAWSHQGHLVLARGEVQGARTSLRLDSLETVTGQKQAKTS